MEFLVVLGLLVIVGSIFENKKPSPNVTLDIPEGELMTPEEWADFEHECLESWPVMNPIIGEVTITLDNSKEEVEK